MELTFKAIRGENGCYKIECGDAGIMYVAEDFANEQGRLVLSEGIVLLTDCPMPKKLINRCKMIDLSRLCRGARDSADGVAIIADDF